MSCYVRKQFFAIRFQKKARSQRASAAQPDQQGLNGQRPGTMIVMVAPFFS